jgi:phenylalanyl-tRNA synthetase alpha chain
MPPGHPSRDVQETFWIDDARLLRTHTTPVQIRSMIERGAPLRIIVPGKTFRRDYDATHFPMFHQVEGLCVDEGIALSDLKGTLEYFARSMFGPDRAIRLRPHHFAYTEPSLEVDVSCMVCGGGGCGTCRQSGWIEILGSGMVHPNVLRNGGVDPDRYSGFAFGMGIERIAQLAYGIEDGRPLFQNDVRFIRQ